MLKEGVENFVESVENSFFTHIEGPTSLLYRIWPEIARLFTEKKDVFSSCALWKTVFTIGEILV